MFCGWDGREPVEFPMSNYRVKIIITELVTLGHGHGRRGGVLLLKVCMYQHRWKISFSMGATSLRIE